MLWNPGCMHIQHGRNPTRSRSPFPTTFLFHCSARTFDRNPSLKALIIRNPGGEPLPDPLDGLLADAMGSSNAQYFWPHRARSNSIQEIVRQAFRREWDQVQASNGAFQGVRYLSSLLFIARKHGMLSSDPSYSNDDDGYGSPSLRGRSHDLSSPAERHNLPSAHVLETVEKGCILVSHPCLPDWFSRTVVLMARPLRSISNDLSEDIAVGGRYGWYGITLNKPLGGINGGTVLDILKPQSSRRSGNSGRTSTSVLMTSVKGKRTSSSKPSRGRSMGLAWASSVSQSHRGEIIKEELVRDSRPSSSKIDIDRRIAGKKNHGHTVSSEEMGRDRQVGGGGAPTDGFNAFEKETVEEKTADMYSTNLESSDKCRKKASSLSPTLPASKNKSFMAVLNDVFRRRPRRSKGVVLPEEIARPDNFLEFPDDYNDAQASRMPEQQFNFESRNLPDGVVGFEEVTKALTDTEVVEAARLGFQMAESMSPEERNAFVEDFRSALKEIGGDDESAEGVFVELQRTFEEVLSGSLSRLHRSPQEGDGQSTQESPCHTTGVSSNTDLLQQHSNIVEETRIMNADGEESRAGGVRADARSSSSLWSGKDHRGLHSMGSPSSSKSSARQVMGLLPNSQVLVGGPVPGVTLMHRLTALGGDRVLPPSDGASEGVFVGSTVTISEAGNILREKTPLPSEDAVKVVLGDSRWDPGQVESEVSRGAWIVLKCSDTPTLLQLFKKGLRSGQQPPSEVQLNLWKRALHASGRDDIGAMASVPRNVWRDLEALEI